MGDNPFADLIPQRGSEQGGVINLPVANPTPVTTYSIPAAVGGADEAYDSGTAQGIGSSDNELAPGIVAVNPSVYPIGTIFKDADTGEAFVAGDKHGNANPNVIDIYTPPSQYTGFSGQRNLVPVGKVPANEIPKTAGGVGELLKNFGKVPEGEGAYTSLGKIQQGSQPQQQQMENPFADLIPQNEQPQSTGGAFQSAASKAEPSNPFADLIPSQPAPSSFGTAATPTGQPQTFGDMGVGYEQKPDVGYLELAGRGLTGAAAKANELMAQGLGIFPYLEDKTLQAFGVNSDIYNRYMKAVHSVGLGQPGVEAAQIKPTEKLPPLGEAVYSTAEMAGTLPYMMMTGGIGAEEAAANEAFQAVKPLLPRITQGIQSMTIPAAESGMDAVKQSAAKGDDQITQTAKGMAMATTTAVMGAVPLSIQSKIANPLYRFLEQGAYGYLTGIPVGEAQKQVNSWVNGQPYVPSTFKEMAVQAIPMGLMTGAFGVLHAPEAKGKYDQTWAGPEQTLAPSANPVVNQREAQITQMADNQSPTLEVTKPAEEAPAPAVETPAAPVDVQAQIDQLHLDQLEHDEGSPEYNAIQEKIDALNKPAEAPAEAQPKVVKLTGFGKGDTEAGSRLIDSIEKETEENQLDPRERIVNRNAAIDVEDSGGVARIHSIRAFERGTGAGRDALNLIIRLADQEEVPLVLDPERFTSEGLTNKQLKDWYSRNGFVEQENGSMRREPKQPTEKTYESVQKQGAREVGVRNAPAVGEGVGTENKAEVPAGKGEAPKEEVAPANPYDAIRDSYYENGDHSQLVDSAEKTAKEQDNQFLLDAVSKFREEVGQGVNPSEAATKLMDALAFEADMHEQGVKPSDRGLPTGKVGKRETEGGYFGIRNPIIKYLKENPILSRSTYLKKIKSGEFTKGGGEYDTPPDINKGHAMQIYREDGQTLDKRHQQMVDEGIMKADSTVEDLWKEIDNASKSASKLEKEESKKDATEKALEERASKLEKLQKTDPEKYAGEMQEDLERWFNDKRRSEGGFIEFPDAVKNAAAKFGEAIYKAGMSFRDWSGEMVKRLGEGVRGFLRRIYNAISTGGGRFLERGAERGSIDLGGEERFKPKAPTERETYAKRAYDALTKSRGGNPPDEATLTNALAKKFPGITSREASDLYASATGKPKSPAPYAGVAATQGEMFPQRTPIGISKESVENQRLARMLDNLPESERESNAAKISDALEKNKNPNIVEGLIHEIIDGGKTIATPEEVALLNVEMNRLQLERERIQNNFDQTEKRPSDYSVLNQELKPIDDKIDRLERAVDKIGTSAGRLLQMFKIMLAEDYSPVALERKAVRDLRRDLTPEEKETIARQAKEIKDLQDKLNQKQGQAEEKDLNESVKDAYERQIAELKEQAKPDPAVQSILNKVANALKSPADAARERIAQRRKERGGRLFTGIDPERLADIADAAIIGAEKIAKGASNLARWTAEMKSEFGDGIIPYIKQIWNKSLENFKNATSRVTEKASDTIKNKVSKVAKGEVTKDDIINRAKAEAEAGEELSHKTVYDLARAHILEGVRGEDNVMKAVHDDIKEAYPDATERDVRRAFSEYGKAKFPSAEEDKVHLRQLRILVRLQESIDRLKQGLPALRTGLQRDRANQAIREKTAILNNLLKQVKVEPTQEQLTSRLEAKKNALRNRIEDLDAQLQGKAKKVEKGQPVPLDAEGERLTSLRDAMQQKLREVEAAERKAAKEKADAEDVDKQRREAQAEIDRIQKSIDEVNDLIASGEKVAPTPKKQPLTEYARLLKEDLKKARKQYKKVIAEPSKSPEEKYNERRQAKIKQDIADIEYRMRRGDYSKKEKKPSYKKTPETELLEKKLADKRREADLWREEKEKAERPIWEKALRTTSETAREITVAGINVLYKIGKYAIAKPITTPIGEVAGYAARNLLGLGKVRGEYESGASPLKTIPAYYRGYWKDMKQFMRVLKSGHSDSELLYDKKKQNNTNWFRWVGSNLHAAIKNIPSTAKEELYREHLYANAIADGLIDPKNPTDPKNQMAMAALNLKAYIASKSEKLQEDNKIAEAINNLHRWAESPDKEGRINPYTSAASHGIKIAITKGIYKIGLNYLKQAAQAGTGLPRGMASALNAHWKGLDTLTPKEMDYITQAFKVGAIPAALMAWAAIDAFKDDKDKVFGGYYEQGRKKGDVKWGDVRINGKQFSLHIPEVEAAQFVNTMARDFRKNASKTDIGMAGVEAFFDAMKGVFSEAPVTGPVTEIAKSPKSFAGYLYQGLVPSAVRDVAKIRDVNAQGEPNYRYPRTSLENIYKGIPGLRETLPSRPQRSSTSRSSSSGLQ